MNEYRVLNLNLTCLEYFHSNQLKKCKRKNKDTIKQLVKAISYSKRKKNPTNSKKLWINCKNKLCILGIK